MKEVTLTDLVEGGSYIIEAPHALKNKGMATSSLLKPVKMDGFTESLLNYEYAQLVNIIKIENPYHVIRTRRGGREFVKLDIAYKYFEPTQEFLDAMKPKRCDDEFDY